METAGEQLQGCADIALLKQPPLRILAAREGAHTPY